MLRIRPHLTYANVMVTLLAFGALTGGVAYAANTVFSTDIVNNEVYGADVRDDTLSNGGLGHIDLKPGSVRGSEVATNSLTGSDVDESLLSQVPSAQNADKLDGKDASQLASGRIHIIGDGDAFPVPGMWLQAHCDTNLARVFITVNDPGTANAIIGGSGVEPDPGEGGLLETRNDVRIDGLTLSESSTPGEYFTVVYANNQTGSAQSESQIVVDAGGKTYSLAMHMYTQDAGGYCELLGTVTVAE